MQATITHLLKSINQLLTTINGFLFGILAGGFSPLHTKKGEMRKIPMLVNVALCAILVLALYGAVFR